MIVFLSITLYSLTSSKNKPQKHRKKENNIQSSLPQSFSLDNSKEFKNKHTWDKTLKELIKSQGCLFVFSTLIGLNTSTVKPIKYCHYQLRQQDVEFVSKLGTLKMIVRCLISTMFQILKNIWILCKPELKKQIFPNR